jgi:hypothetical protein
MSRHKSDTAANSHSINCEAEARAGGDAETRGIVEVVTAVTAVLSAAGGMKMILEMVKLWIEQRKERRIKLKRGDIELELQGSMSQKELEQKIELFRELTREANETEIKIIVP